MNDLIPGAGGGINQNPQNEKEANRQLAAAFDMDAPLARMHGETARAVRAMTDYALLGPSRSQVKLRERYLAQMEEFRKYQRDPAAWPHERAIPQEPPVTAMSTITAWSAKFLWPARAARFDEMQVEVERLEHEADRLKVRRDRQELLKLAMSRLKAALVSLNPNDASWGEVTSGIRQIADQLRTEFGDDIEKEAPQRIRMVVVRSRAGGGETRQVLDVPSADVLAVDLDDGPVDE